MDKSIFLAKAVGLYLVVISIAMLTNMQQFEDNIYSLINNTGIMLVTGCFTVIIGVLMLVSHNIWEWHWRVIITIIAWLVFLKGACLVFFPHFLDSVSLLFVQNMIFAYLCAGLDLILGLVLLYFGFKR